ncbi:hypothetical protein L218DRAFT_1081357 [Marasmius fiardii PR-910]|nr:hypothetical protein L218DRAFT_1081357 [Marasmius fiardii PR-910]
MPLPPFRIPLKHCSSFARSECFSPKYTLNDWLGAPFQITLHPKGNTSLMFASLFRSDMKYWNINATSSYLDCIGAVRTPSWFHNMSYTGSTASIHIHEYSTNLPPFLFLHCAKRTRAALTRGDRFHTTAFTAGNLTTWGYQSCLRDPDNGGLGGKSEKSPGGYYLNSCHPTSNLSPRRLWDLMTGWRCTPPLSAETPDAPIYVATIRTTFVYRVVSRSSPPGKMKDSLTHQGKNAQYTFTRPVPTVPVKGFLDSRNSTAAGTCAEYPLADVSTVTRTVAGILQLYAPLLKRLAEGRLINELVANVIGLAVGSSIDYAQGRFLAHQLDYSYGRLELSHCILAL